MVLLVVACLMPRSVAAQSASARVEEGAVHVRVSGVGFIRGAPLAHLKDGRSIRVELSLRVAATAGAPPSVDVTEACLVSYDLWEERFAVAMARTSDRLVSHLSATDAETWCVERVTFPVTALGNRRDAFFVRLDYRVVDDEPAGDANAGITLRGLVERLSRRRDADEARGTLEFGPLRLPTAD